MNEPWKATEASVALEPPRIAQAAALRIVGLRGEYTSETRGEIPLLWQRFAPHIGRTLGQVGNVAYGVCFCGPEYHGFGYLVGVELEAGATLPAGWDEARLPASRYAVFAHREHVSRLPETLDAIHQWLPTSGLQPAPAGLGTAVFFERYGEEFCPETGRGGMEVWFPLAG